MAKCPTAVFHLGIDQSGRYVAFDTAATNLAPSGLLDTNTVTDVYLLDRQSNALTRISALQDGTDATLEESLLKDIAIIGDELQILFSTTAPLPYFQRTIKTLTQTYIAGKMARSA